MIIAHTSDFIASHWSSVTDMLNAVVHPANLHHVHKTNVEQNRVSAGWTDGLAGMEDMRNLLAKGWKEGVQRMQETMSSLQVIAPPKAFSIRRKPHYGDQGDEIDIERVYAGDLSRAWRTVRRVANAAGRSMNVRIRVAIHGHCNRPTEEFFWRGAVATMLTDLLENAGYRVEVVAYLHNIPHVVSQKYFASVVVKSSEEPLDIERLAIATSHAGFFRVGMLYAILEAPFEWRPGLGTPIHGAKLPMVEENDIVIDNVWNLFQSKLFLKELEENSEIFCQRAEE